MSVVTGRNPYDPAKLLEGPCRVLYADLEEPIPTSIFDIIKVEAADKYAAQTGWTDLGALAEGVPYTRQFETAGYEIENTTGVIAESVTDTVRQVAATMAELTANSLQLFEQAPEVEEIEGTEDHRPEKQTDYGSVSSLDRHRVAFIARRVLGEGADVTEPDGTVRGAFVYGVLFNASLTGDQATIQLAKGTLASAPLTFKAFPEGGLTQGQETGRWAEEVAGEIGGS